MRGKNRKPIASIEKLPQFTTMNVIEGQAGLVKYSSLIFYSLTLDNILNIKNQNYLQSHLNFAKDSV